MSLKVNLKQSRHLCSGTVCLIVICLSAALIVCIGFSYIFPSERILLILEIDDTYSSDSEFQKVINTEITDNTSTFMESDSNSDSIASDHIERFQSLYSSVDVRKYQLTNHSFCDTWFYSKVMLAAHHKSGTILFTYHFLTITQRYYQSICGMNRSDSIYRLKQKQRIFNGKAITLSDILVFEVILHMIRNPVDLIISAFNYHRCAECLGHFDSQAFVKSNISDHHRRNLKCHTTIWNDYAQKLNLSVDTHSVNGMLNVMSMEEGILMEYVIFEKCQYPQLIDCYQIIEEWRMRGRNDSHVHVANFRLEDFSADGFEQMSRIYLDKMGILEEEHRKVLMERFAEHNVHDPSARYSKVKHKTIGKYNKTEQVTFLLSDSKRCNSLKEKALQLDYHWEYSSIC